VRACRELFFRAAKPKATASFLVHGYGGNFYDAYFPKLAEAAVRAGYDTLALTMRDHDAGPKKSSFTDNGADIALSEKILGWLSTVAP